MKHILLYLLLLTGTTTLFAETPTEQTNDEGYRLYLTVRDYTTNEILEGVTLNVLNKKDSTITEIFSENGKVEFDIKPETDYEIKGIKQYYLAKKGEVKDCSVNTENSSKAGYLVCTSGMRMPAPPIGKTIVGDLLMEKIELNKVFVFENIYYDLDKSFIRTDAAIELDKIVTILKDNPTILTELGSHCDSRGSDDYNKELSQRRAEEAVAYIVSKGIKSERIKAQGYGESKLVNNCRNGVQCTDEKHQKNRRTEFKIIGISE